MKEIYVDNAATTKIEEAVVEEMLPYLKEEYGNPSSIYSIGRNARKAVEKAREQVARAIGAKPSEIYFTSCGSEADNTALKGIMCASQNKKSHIITSQIEHPAILDTCKALEKQGFCISYIPVNENGIVNIEELEKAITKDTALVSVMVANNEIGTIEPIKKIAQIARKNGVLFHTDAVQAIGNIPVNVEDLGVDLLSMSAHKFHGPKGVGALYVRSGVSFDKFMNGGHQERNKRAGTENVASIVGMGKAIELACEQLAENKSHMEELREYYFEQILQKIPYIRINGDREQRLPGNTNISFRFIEGESLLLNLDMKGICASSGSACTSGSLDPSHVLLAIGLPHEIAHGSLRVTFSKDNTKEEVDILVKNLVEIVQRLREMSPLYETFIEGGK